MSDYEDEKVFEGDETGDELAHYGTKRHSGRYPWGSGENPYQHTGDFYNKANALKAQGYSQKEITQMMGLYSTKDFQTMYAIDANNRRRDMVEYAKSAKKDGKSNVQIGIELGEKYNEDKSPIGESTVRSFLNGEAEARMNRARETADAIKKIVDEKGTLDVGAGVEIQAGVSRAKLDAAITILQMEGYQVFGANVPQATTKQYTRVKVLAKPGVENKDVYNWEELGHFHDYVSSDDGKTYMPAFQYPASMDSKRLKVRYAEEGGVNKDGLIEIRRGVKDLSLGEHNYSQVRILVDGTHYIKGMAVYSDGSDMPDGVDVIFNTNKSKDVGKMGALKKIKDDPTNPFGSNIKEGFGPQGGQSYYIDDNGEQKLSLINKRADAGDWGEWSKEIPSQMLSKQPLSLIKRQIDLSINQKEHEYEDILEVNNPIIRKEMLLDYADKCDKAAVDLKAAAFPGQKYQVILPLTTTKDNEAYAPNYEDGQQLALIRYPHGGTFEIPIVTVNNRNKEGREVITPTALDAIGINSNVASRLSGADFDGDTVMVIPLSEKVKIKSTDELKGLRGFDPKLEYGCDPTRTTVDADGKEHYFRGEVEFKPMTDTQKQMGVISNLITDMTLKGASEDELARAVRHSMVVIDAEKHHLDYQASYRDNGIKALQDRYQGHVNPETGRWVHGASTLISRAKSETSVPERKLGAYVAKDTGNILSEIDPVNGLYLDEKTGQVYSREEKRTMNIDPKTGKKMYRETGGVYKDVVYRDSSGKKQTARVVEKDGQLFYKDKETQQYKKVTSEAIKVTPIMMESTKMAETDDARKLMSGSGIAQEEVYAMYANRLKALANEARKEYLNTQAIYRSPSAAKTYADEVESLKAKVLESKANAPLEREANMIVASQIKAIKQENPNLTSEEEGKQKARLLAIARAKVGAKRKEIEVTPREWEAIQAGAISIDAVKEIYKRADKSKIMQYAAPRRQQALSTGEINRLKALARKGYTISEIAQTLGVSTSTIDKYLQ